MAGLLTQEAAPGGTVTYTFTASSPGTRAYYSGTQGDLQVEMGLYGAIIVLPTSVPAACTSRAGIAGEPDGWKRPGVNPISGWRRPPTTMPRPATTGNTCSSSPRWIPTFTARRWRRSRRRAAARPGPRDAVSNVPTEPYHPAYFLINGRSMPDLMDPNYAAEYPHQPYNGNPHMHPGELMLMRIIGQGRWQHPFHEHANHVRILARDGNLILSPTDSDRVSPGPLLFTTDDDAGAGVRRDFLLHGQRPELGSVRPPSRRPTDPARQAALYSGCQRLQHRAAAYRPINYYEWCQDHNKPLQVAPFGDVARGGPATLPDPNIFTNGAWYGGSPYLGPDATDPRDRAHRSNLQPSDTMANPASERGWAFMWHSHNEREITTNNIFPGGMLMMMLVDSREFVIDESN